MSRGRGRRKQSQIMEDSICLSVVLEVFLKLLGNIYNTDYIT